MSNKLLVHTCCCHCAAYTLLSFREQGYDVSALWYNPNVYPFQEHEARRQALISLTERFSVPLIMENGYDMPEFLQRVAGHEETLQGSATPAGTCAPHPRCAYCFEMRLSKTADVAIAGGFNTFTTSLLISPWQKHELIKETGERIAGEKGIPFIYADLRKHYSDSRCITKPLGLYRQQYCGCIYSEWERYREKRTLKIQGDVATDEKPKL